MIKNTKSYIDTFLVVFAHFNLHREISLGLSLENVIDQTWAVLTWKNEQRESIYHQLDCLAQEKGTKSTMVMKSLAFTLESLTR